MYQYFDILRMFWQEPNNMFVRDITKPSKSSFDWLGSDSQKEANHICPWRQAQTVS